MPPRDGGSLWSAVSAAGHLSQRAIWETDASVTLGDLVTGSSLDGRLEELRGQSVLVATEEQVTAALALIELDGIARRLVLCPPDLARQHVSAVSATAAVNALVSDLDSREAGALGIRPFITCSPRIAPAVLERNTRHETEWILLTSGTTGLPKMVVHTLSTLTDAIKVGIAPADPTVWSTFYDIRYGGLQVLLRALLGGGSLVLRSVQEPLGDFLIRAGRLGVTHISGTPSHWRCALMSSAAHEISPRYVRLSGEIADQAILDHLQAVYPKAEIAHAFASTEAGVAFEVGDGLAGFPASLVEQRRAGVMMKVEQSSLRIRSGRTGLRYLGNESAPLSGEDGFVDTGDVVDLRGDRYHFVGRRDGIVNVGGLKVHPEEVESVINGHPNVRMSLVHGRKNPITGALVVADVVLRTECGATEARAGGLEREILQLCRASLARHKVPAKINFVPALAVAATGKLMRDRA